METIIFATKNQGKLKEIRAIMEGAKWHVISMEEAGIDIDIEEDGESFIDNAIIKAQAIARMTGKIALADDSGLEVDAMDKAPGVQSARFMGYDTDYRIKNQAILDRLSGLGDSERTARFVCAIAAAIPNGETLTCQATIEGIIGYQIVGEHGFGYDPIFYLPQYGMTTAELSPTVKNEISHRGKALRQMKGMLEGR